MHTTAPPIAPDFDGEQHNGLAVRQNSTKHAVTTHCREQVIILLSSTCLALKGGQRNDWLTGITQLSRWLGSLGLWCWKQL